MKITSIFVLFALSALSEIAQGQLVAVARNFYQPILLSFGAAVSFISSDKVEADSFSWNEWVTSKLRKSEGVVKSVAGSVTKEDKENQKSEEISDEELAEKKKYWDSWKTGS